MTPEEMSNEFDVLYNNITSNQAPGLDEYEKSLFLTKAQDEIIKAYFNPKLNKVQEGFDASERRQIDFSMLIKTAALTPATEDPVFYIGSKSSGTFTFDLSDLDYDPLFIINEKLIVNRGDKEVELRVVPLSHTEYDRLTSKPYGRPLKRQAWRLLNADDTRTAVIIAGSGDTIRLKENTHGQKYKEAYFLRYIKRPAPIILDSLDGLTIDGDGGQDMSGQANPKQCELDPILHHEIVQRAVELAKAAYTGDLGTQVQLGQMSHTEMGYLQSSK